MEKLNNENSMALLRLATVPPDYNFKLSDRLSSFNCKLKRKRPTEHFKFGENARKEVFPVLKKNLTYSIYIYGSNPSKV